jgi:hypothetical protein
MGKFIVTSRMAPMRTPSYTRAFRKSMNPDEYADLARRFARRIGA